MNEEELNKILKEEIYWEKWRDAQDMLQEMRKGGEDV